MKLRITFGVDGSQSIEHHWNDNDNYTDNMRKATIKAMEAGMKLEDMRNGKVSIKAIKERDGECCPCCGTPLL